MFTSTLDISEFIRMEPVHVSKLQGVMLDDSDFISTAQMDQMTTGKPSDTGGKSSTEVFAEAPKHSEPENKLSTTVMHNDANVVTVEPQDSWSMDRRLLDASKTEFVQDIASFLEKPQLMATFDFDAGQLPLHELYVGTYPQDLFAKDLVKRKASGYLNFRGTLHIKVVANAQRFQAGRLICVYIPQADAPQMYPGVRRRTLLALTQLPRVELDVACDTECELVIPYVSPTEYYSMADSTGSFGRVYLHVYSPLTYGVGAESTCSISVYAYLTDVELAVPSSYIAQGYIEEESESFGSSDTSKAVTKLAKGVVKKHTAPLLSRIARPLSWAVAFMDGALSAFGLSNPLNTEHKVVRHHPDHTFANSCEQDHAASLALSTTAGVKVLPGFAGNNVDEMDISSIIQRYAYLYTYTWTAATASGTTIGFLNFDPSAWYNTEVKDSLSYYDMVPACYVSQFFTYWRGSMRLKIKAVKTSFHTGRLQVAFAPRGSPFDIEKSAYLFREILDLRDRSEWEFIIPWCDNRPWHVMTAGLGGVAESMGTVYFSVINELRSPPTCSDTIKILIEVAGGPDMAFAFPHQWDIPRAIPLAATWLTAQSDIEAIAQGDVGACGPAPPKGLGGSEIVERNIAPEEYTIGECITSLAQLLKRYSKLGFFTLNGGGTDVSFPVLGAPNFQIRPASLYGNILADSPNYQINTWVGGDYVNFFFPMFAYSRGGFRIAVASETNTPYTYIIANAVSRTNLAYRTTTQPLTRGPGLGVIRDAQFNGLLTSASVPQYTRLHSRLNRFFTSATPEPQDVYSQQNALWISAFNETLTPGQYGLALYRKVSDDCQLGFFLGTPPIMERVLS